MEYLGDEIQGLKIRSQLECHVKYHWICVTSRRYNETGHDWDRVKYHLKGIWHNVNVSLDLINLHKEIQGLKNAKPLQFDADKLSTEFLDHLKGLVPSWSSFYQLAASVLTIGACVIVVLCLLPSLLKYFISAMLKLQANLHHVRLRNTA